MSTLTLFLFIGLSSFGLSAGHNASHPMRGIPLIENVAVCMDCDSCIAVSPTVTDEACAKCARGQYEWWPCNDSDLCKCDPNAATEVDCSMVVSTDGSTPNHVCSDLCKTQSPDFDSKCIEERYVWASEAKLIDPQCFDNWVYGYADNGLYGVDDNSTGRIGYIIGTTKTPAECQEACQRDSTCVNFEWRMRSDGSLTANEGNCLLKSHDIIIDVLSVPMDRRPDETDSNWNGHVEEGDPYYKYYDVCNLGLRYECHGHYECLLCPDLKCVYKSEYHIGGPKFCGLPISCCNALRSTTKKNQMPLQRFMPKRPSVK